METGSKKLG